ncbi:putative stigma-specific protein Stig1 [Helianthus annuus]|nr:putative stigma-specific protein Stig1 [Helianthus annuus]KAJ0523891.1 putative stigma-specific protein Stig1 [Helianthus annuus]
MNSTTQLFALNPFYQCDIYPRVCLAKGGVAPHCCKKKCVNVITDALNCGSCGKKCKSGEACCKGRCVDVSTSRSNCGLCGMKCRYNESCCKGKCKNTYSDKTNCGACENKCKKGECLCLWDVQLCMNIGLFNFHMMIPCKSHVNFI